ncbi:HEAT repeat domain-containing protein [Kitasatospora sp. NPDC017646]|uniref:HEAT repeat domain-containing protein n=1 Tax=Kitasatospora sp. NPDC017646 TaxID=3364024 RepID=UPI003799BE0B
MSNELDSVDWASMRHAYGPASEVPVWLRGMASADPDVRRNALRDFVGSVHHQGDVYPCTLASLPFLFALADDPGTPDRAGIVRLVVSIGRESLDAVDAGDEVYIAPDGSESTAHVDALAIMRERSAAFLGYSADPDPEVRQSGIEALGLFLDDADQAVGALRDRLPAECGTEERQAVIRTMAELALRLPQARAAATAWLNGLADDAAAEPDIRLAALVHRARCVPAELRDDTVPTVAGLLRRIRPGFSSVPAVNTGPKPSPKGPPHIVAMFEDMERDSLLHAPTTELLRTLHGELGDRVSERSALLVEQLRSPDRGSRYDAIRMTRELIRGWRGDHTGLVLLLADCLTLEDPYTAAAAADALGALAPAAEPAREALASYVAAQLAAHGPNVWASSHPLVRRAHQLAVLALARLGDPRALSCLRTALDGGTDTWRAVHGAMHLGPLAAELVPQLVRLLSAFDLSTPGAGTQYNALLSALAKAADPAAVPAITDALNGAVQRKEWRDAASALKDLASFGPAAAPALEVVRQLADAEDVHLRAAATGALWALDPNPADVVPRLVALLDTYRRDEAAEALGLIGPPAAAALPRLKDLLGATSAWTRVRAATAVWGIAGESEAEAVCQALEAAWESNHHTANDVLACLERMGLAAAPLLPRVASELAQVRRGGRFGTAAGDEELQRACRTLMGRPA